MLQPRTLLRLRLFITSLFLVAGIAPVLGAGAQNAASFEMTSVEFLCKSNESAVAKINMHYRYTGEIASGTASLHNTSTNYSESFNLPPNAFWGNPAWITFQLANSQERMSTLHLRVVMAGEPQNVYEYTAQLGDCGGSAYSISGGLVGDDTNYPQFPIAINNLTCSGFDWSVSAPYEVRVYVSVMDIIGQGMIPYVPVNGTELSRTESFTVTTDNQTNFNVLITVYDIDTDQELARKSMSRTCPIATEIPTVTPEVTPGVTPDVDDQGENTTIIKVEMPNGESIVDDSWELFAPSASMQAGVAALQSGVVGGNNTITLTGLIAGQYRIVISPAGMDAIDFTFTVGTEPVTELLAVVNADGTVTVTAMQSGPAPTATATDTMAPGGSTSGSSSDVSGLPSTGAGEAQGTASMWVFATIILLLGGLGLAVIRRSASTS